MNLSDSDLSIPADGQLMDPSHSEKPEENLHAWYNGISKDALASLLIVSGKIIGLQSTLKLDQSLLLRPLHKYPVQELTEAKSLHF